MSSIPDKTLWGSGSLSEQVISNLAHIPAYTLLTFLWLKSFAGTESKNNIIVFSLIFKIFDYYLVDLEQRRKAVALLNSLKRSSLLRYFKRDKATIFRPGSWV